LQKEQSGFLCSRPPQSVMSAKEIRKQVKPLAGRIVGVVPVGSANQA
jgi:hypothetical protein